jgi:mannose-6-phosphate isomerase-like protein (cupin superfamily)
LSLSTRALGQMPALGLLAGRPRIGRARDRLTVVVPWDRELFVGRSLPEIFERGLPIAWPIFAAWPAPSSLPFAIDLHLHPKGTNTIAIPQLIPAAEGRHVRFQGLGTRYIVPGEQTAGAFAIIEHDLAPRVLGAPMHSHEREDEISHVAAGRLGVQIGDDVVEAGPGDTIVKPRGVAHAFWNPGNDPVRFLELITPPGFEHYFADIEPFLATGAEPDFDALSAIMARYGLSMDMDSMPGLIATHGLDAPPA